MVILFGENMVEQDMGEQLATSEHKKGRPNFLDRGMLVKLKSRAMRAGVWFRCLPRIDRVLVDLTIKVADYVRSPYLFGSLIAVAGKLEGLLESKLERAIREFGVPLARKLSVFAQRWGNRSASEWGRDPGFVRYLAVMKLNGNPCMV
jgi:hypothetical protein